MGGATYDVALRFLHEDPWERLAALRAAVPNICLQMLLRGRNTVGYSPYPETVTEAFVREAAATGIDIFRIFDALNDVDQMTPAIDAVLETGTAVAEVAMSYTGDLMDPNETLYDLDYYLRLADRIAATGAHVLAIKDMAGLLRAPAATKLVGALRERFDLPIHVHTHDTPGGQLATYLAAMAAGADAVDGASAPCPARRASPRCHRSSPRPRTPSTTPASTCRRCATWSRTGMQYGGSTHHSSREFRHRRAGCTGTRSRADSCRTCDSRPWRWVWVTASKTSRPAMPTRTGRWVTWSR
ncbi:hypothetical protein MTP03_14960 [Tsukamurella sp. PLM1]|nr:hypothetical protein MTP03_14960 [Tsukamurella sp. PLM1]